MTTFRLNVCLPAATHEQKILVFFFTSFAPTVILSSSFIFFKFAKKKHEKKSTQQSIENQIYDSTVALCLSGVTPLPLLFLFKWKLLPDFKPRIYKRQKKLWNAIKQQNKDLGMKTKIKFEDENYFIILIDCI